MGWTSPRTWASAILTAAQLNVDVRDNLNFLYAPPKCRLNNDFDNIPTATLTACQFSSEEFDNDGMHSTSSNINRCTINTAGVYLIVCAVEFPANSTGSRQGTIRINGNNIVANTEQSPDGNGNSMFQVTVVRAFAVGDYIEFLIKQDSGSTLNTLGMLTAHWLSN